MASDGNGVRRSVSLAPKISDSMQSTVNNALIPQSADVHVWNYRSQDSASHQHNYGYHGTQNTFSGMIVDDSVASGAFDDQMHQFKKSGVALDPSGQYYVQRKSKKVNHDEEDVNIAMSIVNTMQSANTGEELGGKSVSTATEMQASSASDQTSAEVQLTDSSGSRKKKRKNREGEAEGERRPEKDPSNVASFLGTWGDLSKRVKAPTKEEAEEAAKQESEEGEGVEPKSKKSKTEPESVFHGSATADKMWLQVPKSLEGVAESRINYHEAEVDHDLIKLLAMNEPSTSDGSTARSSTSTLVLKRKFSPSFQNFIPKKVVHTWQDSQMAVSACRFIPKYGHLLLASSMDHCIRIYETSGKKRCMMTYKGHSHAVRAIDWNPAGTQFLSASFDKFVRLWDAETGKTIGKFNENSDPYCISFWPSDPNIFLVGQANRKIVQWDTRSNEISQEYNRHLGAVNSITWIDENRRFVTSSDDKSIRIWNFNIPIDIKYIADPKMHSMPCITTHPNGKYFLCQGLDNKIHVYSTREKFPANHKKKFTGHLVSGYACHISVSPDGRCVTSGDSSGSLFFWDWKTCKLLKKMKQHNKVVIDAQWHPLETSKVATASWDCSIKMWE